MGGVFFFHLANPNLLIHGSLLKGLFEVFFTFHCNLYFYKWYRPFIFQSPSGTNSKIDYLRLIVAKKRRFTTLKSKAIKLTRIHGWVLQKCADKLACR